MDEPKFRMGRLDHVHIRVPNRGEAARWYADPWGNRFELNCYEYDRIKRDLIDSHRVKPERYWPRELYTAYWNR